MFPLGSVSTGTLRPHLCPRCQQKADYIQEYPAGVHVWRCTCCHKIFTSTRL